VSASEPFHRWCVRHERTGCARRIQGENEKFRAVRYIAVLIARRTRPRRRPRRFSPALPDRQPARYPGRHVEARSDGRLPARAGTESQPPGRALRSRHRRCQCARHRWHFRSEFPGLSQPRFDQEPHVHHSRGCQRFRKSERALWYRHQPAVTERYRGGSRVVFAARQNQLDLLFPQPAVERQSSREPHPTTAQRFRHNRHPVTDHHR